MSGGRRRLRAFGALLIAVGVATLTSGCRGVADEIVIAHFGDSTCSTDYLPTEQRVDAVLNAQLAARYPQQKIDSRNVARSGEHVRAFLDGGRYERTRGQLDHVDIGFIRYGQNDMKFYQPEEFKAHVEELCDRLEADFPGVHLLLETNTYVDPAHGGSAEMNARYDRYWEIARQVARERGYPLVDVFSRRMREAAAGNWDQNRRRKQLALERFGYIVLDDARDGEMAGVKGWFSDSHPNPNGVRIIADEEFRVLTATWPERLPVAAAP